MVKRQAYAVGNTNIYGIAVVQYKEDNRKTIDELAHEVLDRKWGDDPYRKKALTEAGYDAKAVQDRVNEIYRGQQSSQHNMQSSAKFCRGKYIVNTPKGLNVRAGAGTNYAVKKIYKNGTRFDTLEIKGDWGRSPSGWVNLNYCKLVKAY